MHQLAYLSYSMQMARYPIGGAVCSAMARSFVLARPFTPVSKITHSKILPSHAVAYGLELTSCFLHFKFKS